MTDLSSPYSYISGATSPGVTLQGTLLNHTVTANSIHAHVIDYLSVLSITNSSGANTLPNILGETNSLYNEGRPGLSKPFGAALWGVDFNLYAASQNITRVHMHMGTGYRYQAWQPIDTSSGLYTPTTIGTKAPYYGSIAVAAILGNVSARDTRVANLPLQQTDEAAYAVYGPGNAGVVPSRIAVINMLQYNYTALANGTGLAYPAPRPERTYTFQLPPALCAGTTTAVRRLNANGSDAVTGITWDGYSYNWELEQGRPVLLSNVTRDEVLAIAGDGSASVSVPASGVAVLDLACR